MRALVLGASGYVGAWVAHRLAAAGWKVFGLARGELPPSVEPLRVDLRDRTRVAEIILPLEFDLLVNAVGADGAESEQLLLGGMGDLLAVCRQKQIEQIVSFSTFHVYGRVAGRVNESTQPEPLADYGRIHLAAEALFEECPQPTAILRLSNGYGVPKFPGRSFWRLLVNDLIRMCWDDGALKLASNGLSRRDFVALADVGDLVVRIAQRPLRGRFNVSSGVSLSVLEVAKIVRDAFQELSGKTVPIDMNAADRSPAGGELFVSSERIQDLTGWRPTDQLRQSVGEFFRHLERGERFGLEGR